MYHYGRMRDLREDADLTQKEIGRLLGTTQQQYAKYELGVQEIPTHHLITLAEYYCVTLDYLAGRADWDECRFYQMLRQFSPTQKEAFLHKLQRSNQK